MDALVERNGALVLDDGRLGEPSSIAHSAFMLLALLASNLPRRESKIGLLAEGILQQQRSDGSYKIHFGPTPDQGLEFYPGEAMLALMESYAAGTRDPRFLASVERGFAHHRRRFTETVAPDLLVFYANWQSQYAVLLHEYAQSDRTRSAVRDHVFALHDRILASGFYDGLGQFPTRQATVEVASALEGANEAYAIAVRERDGARAQLFERCIGKAVRFLFRAQRVEGCTTRERGGFGHSLGDRTQRIDVTGHVVSGFLKTVRNQVAAG